MAFKPPFVSKETLLEKLASLDLLTDKIKEALKYADAAHKNQKRDQGNAYLEEHIYPIAMGIIERYQNDPDLENIVILGILHDVLEDDPNVVHQDIEDDFGKDMLADLLLVTKKPQENTSKLSQEEKRAVNVSMLNNLKSASRKAQIVKLEDRLNNLSSFEKADTPKYQRYVEEVRALFIPFADQTMPSYVNLFEEQLSRFE
jgi:(p)ppGpp synthase/HD superfamily hydrolase